MAQQITRVNLAAMAFPFLSELNGRGIFIKQADQNYVAQVTSDKDLDKDIGIPYLYYCHNVIPTSQGYQSIDYTTLISSISGVNNFSFIFPVLFSSTSAQNKAYIGVTADGKVYYSYDPYYNWTLAQTIPSIAGARPTTAIVNGTTYVYFAKVGCYYFDFSANQLVSQTLTGLTTSDILGITSAVGYMIAWDQASVAWSSLVTPTDFTPSLVTGAGGGSVQGAKGAIVACVPHTTGFIVYTNQNAVAAPGSGNARYPFNFRELVNSGGIASLDMVTWDANTGNHYVYTTSGLQIITLVQTNTVFPELTDFLAGSVFEDFDEITNTFSTVHLDSVMKKKMSMVSDRYLIISYGIQGLTHALVYDISLKRWGKFKVNHIDCFEFSLLTAETVETPRRSIAFLGTDGSVNVVKIDSRNSQSTGVVLLGKYQYIRTRLTHLLAVDVENVQSGYPFSINDLYSLDGKTLINKAGYLQLEAPQIRKYLFSVVGVNHSLLMVGSFNLTCLVLTYTIHGRR